MRVYYLVFELLILFLSNYCLQFHQIHQAFLGYRRPHILSTLQNHFIFIILYRSCGHLITHFVLKDMYVSWPFLLNQTKNQSESRAVFSTAPSYSWHSAHKWYHTGMALVPESVSVCSGHQYEFGTVLYSQKGERTRPDF